MLDHDPFPDAHPCVSHECPNIVQFDDEPYCFTHSPDSGSNVPGYSYKRSLEKLLPEFTFGGLFEGLPMALHHRHKLEDDVPKIVNPSNNG